MYVSHPLIKENKVEKRKYQECILKTAEKKNTLVVLPTGIGKTIIAVLLAAKRLEKYPESKILVLTPTKPLVVQHKKSFEDVMNLSKNELVLVTGSIKPEKRKKLYEKAKIIFSTPQTIENDLNEGRLSLENFSLLVVDEAHRAVGKYAYTFIAKKYMSSSRFPLILALTASPGSDEERINEICENLFIRAIEIRSERDEDVRPYVKPVQIIVEKVSFDSELEDIRNELNEALKKYKEKLKEFEITFSTKKELLEVQSQLAQKVKHGRRDLAYVLALVADALKVWHALELLETQSVGALREYFQRLKQTPQGKRVFALEEVRRAFAKAMVANKEHPKMQKLVEIIEKELSKNKNVKILIFSHYRDNIKEIYERLKKIPGCKPCYLIGQAGEMGLSQKEQIEVIKRFENGEFNCMIGSPVSEEGLHIPSVDIGIFYDAVPSEIRLIQRRGRIGRTKFGKIIFILLRRSRDEAYYYTALRKEKKMREYLKMLKNMKEKCTRKTLFDF